MSTQTSTRLTTAAAPAPVAWRSLRLQRKCACGGDPGPGGECEACRKKRLQKRAAIAESTNHFEREADRAAESVNAGRSAPALSALTGDHDTPVPPIVHEVVQGGGQAMDATTRQTMSDRFGYNFGRVRVHSDTRAQESARTVNAQAYTVGSHVVFDAGRYAPATREGQRLLAHELSHVVQQSGAPALQRQPDETSTKEDPPAKTAPAKTPPATTPPAKAPPRKTLKTEGVDLNDPVAGGTAAIIDAVLARNQKLAPFIGDKIKAGLKIGEKGKFVHDTNDGNFDNAYRNAYNISSGDTVPKSTKGFLDPKKSEIHLRPDALFGTALHEAVHRLASPFIYSVALPTANKISTTLVEVLAEGVTAFFTDTILKEEGLSDFNDAYRSKKDKAADLIAALKPDGFDLMATFNFKGTGVIEIGEKLGYTRKQFGDAKGNGIKEVLKRMGKML